MIKRELFRIKPAGNPEDYKTYQVLQPRKTHFRPASCAEVDCPNYARGWKTTVDVSTQLGRKQANYIRLHSGRRFTFAQTGDLVAFTFSPGQNCFQQHRTSLQRPPLLRIKGGDYRGNPRNIPTVTHRPEDWLDDFGTHQLRLKQALERG